MKRTLVIRNADTNIVVKNHYMHIREFKKDFIVSFRHIDRVYLNKNIHIDIGACYKISQRVKLFIIDHNGYILSELKKVKNA